MPKYTDHGRITTNQVLDFGSTGGTSGSSAPFGTQTYIARLASTAACHFRVYDATSGSSTCTSADPLLPVGVITLLNVTPGQRISACAALVAQYGSSTVASIAGRISITELS